MFRTHRRLASTSSDSSEDESPKQQIKLISSGYAQNIVDITDNTLLHKSCKQQVKRHKDNSTSSDSSFITNQRKHIRRVLSTDEDSSSSKDGERLDSINLRISANSRAEMINGGGSGETASSLNQIMNSATTSIQSCLRQVEREESDNSDVISPRRMRRKLVTSEDSASSDNEEIFHPARRGALRALSDYESGNSLEGVRPTRGELRRLSDSSSDDDVIRIRLNGRSKRQFNPIVTSDSSDSGIPIGLNRIRKRMRICSSEDTDTNESNRRVGRTATNTINESSRRAGRPRHSTNVASRRVVNSTHESARRPRRTAVNARNRIAISTRNESSRRAVSSTYGLDRSPAVITRSRTTISTRSEPSRRVVNSAYEHERRPAVNTRSRTVMNTTNESSRRTRTANHTNRPTTSRDTRPVRRGRFRNSIQVRSNRNGVRRITDSSSSDDDIDGPPALIRQFHSFIDFLLSSGSDSNDNFPVSNPIRFRNVPVIQESDEDSVPSSQNRILELVDDKTISTLNNSMSNKTSLDCSSDSDGESEKCSICLARFNSQEVGSPATCEHSFCATCILEWAKSNNTCPIDRQYFTSITVRAQLQGQIVREVPIQNSPTRNVWENSDWWERWEIHNAFNPLSDYDSDGDGPEEVCCICYRSEDGDAMIVCDYCMQVYHMSCVDPPLIYVPAHDWFCPPCVQMGITSDSE